MAADLGWVASKISKIERGDQMPAAEDIQAWTARCGKPEAAEELLGLLADAQTIRDDARRQARHSQASRQVGMAERAKSARRIRDAEPMAIPGLLQTPGYARAIAGQVALVYGAGDIDAAVQARMDRQVILYERNEDTSPRRTFQFVITEAALNMPPCPVPAMLAQLYHLLDVLDLDNVTLAVIPMSTELRFAAFFGFMMLDSTVIVEDYLGSNEHTGEAAEVFDRIFGLLMDQAVKDKDQVRVLIEAAAAKLSHAPQPPA
jgi:hypothetical protein